MMRLVSEARAKCNPAIRKTLETEERIIIHTELINVRRRQVNPFNTNRNLLGNIIIDTGVELSPRRRNGWEAQCTVQACTRSRVERAERIPPCPTRSS